MHVFEASGNAAIGKEYRLSRPNMERRGRWRLYGRALGATALFCAAQLPAWLVARGDWEAAAGASVAPVVPARISLVLDLAMIVAYVWLAFRAVELVWSARAPRVFRRVARVGMALVVIGAILDVTEDVVLWVTVDNPSEVVTMRLPISPVMITLVCGGLLVVSATAVLSSPGLWWRRACGAAEPRRWWRWSSAYRVIRWLAAELDRDPVGAVARWRGMPPVDVSPAEPDQPDQPDRGDGSATATTATATAAAPGEPGEPGEPEPQPGLIICCSGGGIRSAAFCLGGLQSLVEAQRYQRAHAVVGVSGGGYIAAAYHVARWQPASPTSAEWQPLDPPVFSAKSPELRWLRRHTRYLFDSGRVAVLGVLSLLFGIAVNLALLAAVLGGAAWWLGWLLPASGAVGGWNTADAVAGRYPADWVWLGWLGWLPAAGIGLFLLEKFIDRYSTINYQWREWGRSLSYWLILGGLAAGTLLVWLPRLLAALHDYAAGSGSAAASLIYALGLVPDEVCRVRLTMADGCGMTVGGHPDRASTDVVSLGSFAAIATAVLAVVRGAWTVLGADKNAGQGVRAWFARLWPRAKAFVLPWLAVVLIGGVVVVLMIRWVAVLLAEPALLAQWRLIYAVAALLAVIALFTDANRTSMHHFYRERLSHAFLVARHRGRAQRIEPVAYRTPLRFSRSAPRPPGDQPAPSGSAPAGSAPAGPQLVSCAVANIGDNNLVPTNRGCTPFIFDHSTIGLTDHLLPTGQAMTASGLYEFVADRRYRDATIPAAMAISGAAVSPLAGRHNVRVGPYRLVLALANARLGVWLPNPLWIDDVPSLRRLIKLRQADDVVAAWLRLPENDRWALVTGFLNATDQAWLYDRLPADQRPAWFERPAGVDAGRQRVWWHKLVEEVRGMVNKPGPLRLAREAIGKTSYHDRLLYVTDGGHYDNLGLVEALRRRPKEVIVLGASSDPEDSFQMLGEAIATARMDLDCEVDFDPRCMRKLNRDRATAAWGRGTVQYHDGTEGTILLAKVILVDGLPWDLETYAASNPHFPRTSTGKQLYGEFDLEAYRILGREVTKRLVET